MADKATGEKVACASAAWLEPARADLKRYKDRVKPVGPGGVLPLVAGAPVLGFHPVDYAGALSVCWLGPEPKGLVFVGKLEAGVGAVTLVLGAETPAGVGALRLFWNGAALAPEPAPVPERFAVHRPPGAWRAALPATTRDVSILEIRLDRTAPDPGQTPPTRLVGIGVHAIVFAGGEP